MTGYCRKVLRIIFLTSFLSLVVKKFDFSPTKSRKAFAQEQHFEQITDTGLRENTEVNTTAETLQKWRQWEIFFYFHSYRLRTKNTMVFDNLRVKTINNHLYLHKDVGKINLRMFRFTDIDLPYHCHIVCWPSRIKSKEAPQREGENWLFLFVIREKTKRPNIRDL